MPPSDSVILGEVRVYRDARVTLAESPWWQDGDLYWCDIASGRIHISPDDGAVDGSDDTVLDFAPPLASFQPVRGGGFVAAQEDRIVLLTHDGEEVREIARVPHAREGMRMNEGKVDPAGRFVVGSMDEAEGDPIGAFYAVDPGGIDVLVEGLATANGLEWSLDERTVYLTDTGAGTIYRADWREDGTPGELQPFSTDSPSDGLTIDRDGCFWNARFGEGVVVRLDADGRELLRVEVPAPNVTGVAFGGPDLDVLFIGSSREELDDETLARFPHSGGIFSVRTATAGVPVRSYEPGDAA